MSELKVDAISESTGNNSVRMGHDIFEKENAGKFSQLTKNSQHSGACNGRS